MKILYLNHVCWEWIFQRPQIIELQLEKDFECTVLNKKFIFGKTVARNNIKPQNEEVVWLIPKGQQFKFISLINEFIYKLKVRSVIKQFDVIWICHPLLYSGIPHNYNGKVIYDCMDNHVAMAEDCRKQLIKKAEEQLIERADILITTSQKLKDTVPGLNNAYLIRNGYLSTMERLKIKPASNKTLYKIGYFGTLSTWFDFSLLRKSLLEVSNLEYHLIGPLSPDLNQEVTTKGIIKEGIVEHQNLAKYVDEYDALVMPFIVNDIILSVDPVKLYEYINLGKCIISVWYPEIERFSPFVYFYKNEEEYFSLLNKLKKEGFPVKYSESQRKIFLQKNTWDSRYEEIKDKVLNIEKYNN